ncbi:basic blue protein [Cajanus cajan]|uniref:Basic blue protein n=1 Tax=Cajanus cajan TaxID=3821 RepID=A0A151T7U6_CAJCA|nr:basic blue protein [Cajanus cajan]KYP63138.1 Basic blue protein [Cajanus cajan]
MAQGRGISAIVMVFYMLVVSSEMAHAKSFVVGDAAGWTFKMTNWTSGKTFKAGDTLEFNYNPSIHNVVVVDEAGYNSCSASKGSKKYQSGHDHINLAKGGNYFICTFPGHCQADMKIAVNAA